MQRYPIDNKHAQGQGHGFHKVIVTSGDETGPLERLNKEEQMPWNDAG